MVKTFTEWRFAYNDCKFCYDFLQDNEDRLKHPINARSAGHLGLLETPICALLIISVIAWNHFNEVPISPTVFLSVFLAINLVIVLAYFIYYPTQYYKIVKYRTKIGIYQATWPSIVDVINDAEDDNYLPEEPEKVNFVEIPVLERIPSEEPKATSEEAEEATTLVFQPLLENKHGEKNVPATVEKIYSFEDLKARWGIAK